jgi:hypothetical protein
MDSSDTGEGKISSFLMLVADVALRKVDQANHNFEMQLLKTSILLAATAFITPLGIDVLSRYKAQWSIFECVITSYVLVCLPLFIAFMLLIQNLLTKNTLVDPELKPLLDELDDNKADSSSIKKFIRSISKTQAERKQVATRMARGSSVAAILLLVSIAFIVLFSFYT